MVHLMEGVFNKHPSSRRSFPMWHPDDVFSPFSTWPRPFSVGIVLQRAAFLVAVATCRRLSELVSLRVDDSFLLCRTFLHDLSLHVSARRIDLITWARQSCFIHFRRIQLCVLWRLCRLSSRCATASDYRIHICSSPRCVHLRLYPSPHFVVSSPGCCARRTSTPPLAPPVPLLHLQHSLEERILPTFSARVIGLALRLSSLIIVVMLVPVPRPHLAPPAARHDLYILYDFFLRWMSRRGRIGGGGRGVRRR